MKISEAIVELQKYLETEGDLEFYTALKYFDIPVERFCVEEATEHGLYPKPKRLVVE